MKPSSQLRISQNLTMVPQLQHAVRLLQLSSVELQAEIQEALNSNMVEVFFQVMSIRRMVTPALQLQ